ncbi:MAG: phosphoglucosamine mutase [Thermoguttaceae bacterium]|nr:phosphoglucosamine mutase [Thermoguttaceae bacterium]
MTAPLIISVSGLRGEVGKTLTPEVAMRYALAFSLSIPQEGPFVITWDGRSSGSIFADALCAALNAAGRPTLVGGVAATPTTGVLVRSLGAAGGIQISASHNPIQFNGLKLFSGEGRVIPKAAGEKVLETYKALEAGTLPYPWKEPGGLGTRGEIADTVSAHISAILETVDAEKIAAKGFRVLLDSNHGAGSVLGKPLLRRLGCEVICMGEEPNGLFAHTPEPTAENLAGILEQVRAQNVDAAFCQDPDADRLAVIDAGGRYIGEEYTVAICAKHKLAKKAGPVVINCATSRMTIDVAESFGVPAYRSAVGEANVVDRLLESGGVFAGEGNGGPIDPAVGLVRDSFVGMANILEAMADRGLTVAQLADELPRYAIIKQKATLPADRVAETLDRLEGHYKGQKTDRGDGLRVDFADSWVLIRASNTEPIVRIIAEAPAESAALALCDEVRALIEA